MLSINPIHHANVVMTVALELSIDDRYDFFTAKFVKFSYASRRVSIGIDPDKAVFLIGGVG